MSTMDEEWLRTVDAIATRGEPSAPRNRSILELHHHAVAVDMRFPVLTHPARKLGYRFMAAEAFWILSGSERLDEIEPYAPRMKEFSDDGVTLAGAYGPRVVAQLDYVVKKLLEDRDTRQATMTLWTPNPAPSKDIPCTIALDFKIRNAMLHCHAFMRSSDAWLGLPYDVFSFTCVAALVLSRYRGAGGADDTRLGTLHLTAASRHLYAADLMKYLYGWWPAAAPTKPLPLPFYGPPTWLYDVLRELRDSAPGDEIRWWA